MKYICLSIKLFFSKVIIIWGKKTGLWESRECTDVFKKSCQRKAEYFRSIILILQLVTIFTCCCFKKNDVVVLGFPQVARHFLIPKCWVTFKQTEHLYRIQLDQVSKFLWNHAPWYLYYGSVMMFNGQLLWSVNFRFYRFYLSLSY